jgi:peptide deformylase
MAATEHDHDAHDHEHSHDHDAHDHSHDHDHDHGGERRSKKEIEREARARAREMVARSQIRQYPEPVLKTPATEVTEFSDDLRALVVRMTRLMDDANGVGLAGNQVGLLRRVLVYRPDRDDEAEPRALVNPSIVERSDETESDEEGCLSLGPLRVQVERNVRVSVEARDENGEAVRIDADGFEARVLQHEIDHLDGVLIIDRTTPEARREALAALRPQPGPRR